MLSPCKLILTVCIQLLRYGFEALASGLQVMMPCSGIVIRQLGFCQNPGEFTAKTDSFIVWNQASKRSSILEQHKGHVLVMGTVNAIGEIARRVCNGDGGSFHENQLSDIT